MKSDVKEQVSAAEAGALVVPEGGLSALIVTGKDRVSWLNGLLTCDLTKRRPGDAAYGLLVTKTGKIQADVVVIVEESRLLALVPEGAASGVLATLDHHLIMEDAEVVAAPLQAFTVHGPRSADVLGAARAAGASGGLLDRTGLGGCVVVGATAEALAQPSLGAVVGDDAGWEALRIARGVPRWGVDFDANTYPHEAGLERAAVAFDKGCYLGQEVVCMLEMRGQVKRKLVQVAVVGATRGDAVTDEGGGEVGVVTSAATDVALAMVKRASAAVGTRLRVQGKDAEVAALVR